MSQALQWLRPGWAGGPGGGSVEGLAIVPGSPTTVYAGTSGGVFKSTDGGGTWLATGLRGFPITCLAVDPQHPAILYAGTALRLYKSSDGGVNWLELSLASSNQGFVLTLDPVTPSTIYASSFGTGVFKSTDAGANWTALPGFITNGGNINSLLVDPLNPGTIYAAGCCDVVNQAGVDGLFKSGGSYAKRTYALRD